jgi:hypothetical protein
MESMMLVYQAKLEQAQQHLAALDRLRVHLAEEIASAQTEVLLCQQELAACEGKLVPADYVV